MLWYARSLRHGRYASFFFFLLWYARSLLAYQSKKKKKEAYRPVRARARAHWLVGGWWLAGDLGAPSPVPLYWKLRSDRPRTGYSSARDGVAIQTPSRIRRPENSEERVLRSNPYEKRRFPPPRQACQRHEYVWYALLPARYACLLVAMLRSIATSKQAYRTAEPALCMPCHACHACCVRPHLLRRRPVMYVRPPI